MKMGKKAVKNKTYIVKVKGNENFCGKGAGGVQFANGKAEVDSVRMANWFKEHEGYEVIEIDPVATEEK